MPDKKRAGRRLPAERQGATVNREVAGTHLQRATVNHEVAETHLQRARRNQELTIRALELLNAPTDRTDAIRDILLLIKEFTGFEAVGIRLQEDEDFPYYETSGFPAEFVEAERYLCPRNRQGKLLRDSNGKAVLECMCGNVICGRFDPSLPFFTENGSFWSNCTTELLASTSEEERQARTRNRCNGEGYESVALIPLRSDNQTIGLLQLNDSRKDVFSPEFIAFLERLGAGIGIALARKRAEGSLLQALSELEHSNRELEAFAYSVSHDLRAPLRAIDGFTEVLQEDYEAHLDAEGQDYLQRVRAGVQRMGQLIDDLLQLSRIGRAEMRCETVNLSAMFEEIASELRQTDSGRQAEFVAPPDLEDHGDPTLLRIVLYNLLANAWKFTGQMDQARIELSVQEKNGERVYVLRDNGAGFDMTYAGKLFGVFQRLHTSNEFPGTGVGLATVQRVIRRHGGRVWAEGAVDQGATFYFTLAAR